MIGMVEKIQRNKADYGLKITLEKILSSLFSIIYLKRTYRIYMYDLTAAEEAPPEEDNLDYRLIDAGEKSLIRQIETMTEWLRGELEEKLKKGHCCLCALDGDKVAGYNLIALESIAIPLLRMSRNLRPHRAWSEQINVSKQYRRRGIAGKMRKQVFRLLREKGCKRLYGGALISNKASLKLAEKLGFIMLADITLHKILSVQYRTYRRVVQ